MKKLTTTVVSAVAVIALSPLGLAQDKDREGDRPEKGDRDRPERAEGAKRDGERPKEGDRDRDRPERAEGAKRDGDRPKGGPRDGDRPKEGPRDGERPKEGPRDGDRPQPGGPRDGDRPAPSRGGFIMMLPVHAALDVDKNGEISADEIGNASKVLGRLDANKDGKLTEEELRPKGMRPPGDRPAQAGEPRRDRPQGGSMADRMKAMDKNGNGNLEANELPEQFRDRMMDRLDKNGDSVISREELGAAAEAMRGREGDAKGGERRPGAEREGTVKPKRPPLEE